MGIGLYLCLSQSDKVTDLSNGSEGQSVILAVTSTFRLCRKTITFEKRPPESWWCIRVFPPAIHSGVCAGLENTSADFRIEFCVDDCQQHRRSSGKTYFTQAREGERKLLLDDPR